MLSFELTGKLNLLRASCKYTLPLALLLVGCGQGGGAVPGYPAPGEMQVVSMERLEQQAGRGNLLRNGDFRDWWAGAPVPNGFLPPDPELSTVAKIPDASVSGLMQSWSSPLRETELESSLRAETAALEQGKSYILEATAVSTPGQLPALSLWQRDDAGTWRPFQRDILILQPSAMGTKTYRRSFVASASGPAMLASTSSGTGLPDQAVGWLEWRLTASTGATP